MLGFMSKAEALAAGYTNHGRLFGVPVWLGDLESGAPRVAGKHIALDGLLIIAEAFFALTVWLLRIEEPMYPFLVGPEIGEEDSQ